MCTFSPQIHFSVVKSDVYWAWHGRFHSGTKGGFLSISAGVMERPRLLATAGDRTRRDTDLGPAGLWAGSRPPAVVTARRTQTSRTPFDLVCECMPPAPQPPCLNSCQGGSLTWPLAGALVLVMGASPQGCLRVLPPWPLAPLPCPQSEWCRREQGGSHKPPVLYGLASEVTIIPQFPVLERMAHMQMTGRGLRCNRSERIKGTM